MLNSFLVNYSQVKYMQYMHVFSSSFTLLAITRKRLNKEDNILVKELSVCIAGLRSTVRAELRPKLNFLATTNEGIFWRKDFVEKNTLTAVKHGGGSITLLLCGSWGHRKYCASGRKNGFHQIVKHFGLMFKGQSRYWSWSKVGVFHQDNYPKHTVPQNQPWSTSRKGTWRFWNGHYSPLNLIYYLLNIHLKASQSAVPSYQYSTL